MNLNDVHRGIKKYKKSRRIGRGPGSGRGKTAARGHKGQRSRAGFSMHPTFEGGQMPLVRRTPKRGFNNRFAVQIATLNVGELEGFEGDVTIETLKAAGKLKGRFDQLKILGDGELTKKLKVSAHRFSKTAEEKIKAAGGEVEVLPGKAPVVKNKMKQKA